MPRPMIQDGHDTREMTDAEYAQWQQDAADLEAQAATQEAAVAAKASAKAKLTALGLTEEEINALTGGI